MRRTKELVEISRRDFCALAGCAGLIIAGCTDGEVHTVQTGGLGDTPDAPDGVADAPPGTFDAPPGSPDARPIPDAPMGTPDAAGGPVCASGAMDVGAASSFTTNNPKMFSSGRFYVVRDSGGLYAVSSICTHEGATNGVDSGIFLCPRHGAQFTFNGDIISGPVFIGLVHYAMCFMANGNVGVIASQQVSQSTRLSA